MHIRQLTSHVLKHPMNWLLEKMGLGLAIRRLRKAPPWSPQEGRISYQSRYVDFGIRPQEQVLDLGSGGHPFPYATVIADAFPKSTSLRGEPLVTAGKRFVVADVHYLPFPDSSFDFVYCAHVLEEVENPLKACQEIMRVGKRGFIECPTMGKDALFVWAKYIPQRWHVVAIASHLCFFEYSERQQEGIRSTAWLDLMDSKWYHPLQNAFYENQDIFNVMFCWTNGFAASVFRLDGTIEMLDAGGKTVLLARSKSDGHL